MVDWCTVCQANVEVAETGGTTCCVQCGTVLENFALSKEVEFVKDASGGAAKAVGVLYRGEGNELNREAAEARGRRAIQGFVEQLRMGGQDVVEGATRSYKMAWHLGFVKGRSSDQVAAASLYLVCRLERIPVMLIELSDLLGINVFKLGKVYLDLLVLMHMDQQDQFLKPIDPSLYVHRFVEKMPFGAKSSLVATTTLRLIASMKRDWMITGRRPSGIVGAALFLAAHIHDFPEMRKVDVIRIVHVGETTIQTRLEELGRTEMAQMRPAEFDERSQLYEQSLQQLEVEPPKLPIQDPNFECKHVENNKQAFFALGLCKQCFMDMIKVTPDFAPGFKDPPSFSQGIRKLKKKKQKIKSTDQQEILLVQDLDTLSKKFEPIPSQQETDENIEDEQVEDPNLVDDQQIQQIQQIQNKDKQIQILNTDNIQDMDQQSLVTNDESVEDNSVVQITESIQEKVLGSESSASSCQEDGESQRPHDTQVEMVSFTGVSEENVKEKQQSGSQDCSESEDMFDFEDSESGPKFGKKRKQSDKGDDGSEEDSDVFDLEEDEDEDQGMMEEEILSDTSDIYEYIATPAEIEQKRIFWDYEFKDWEIEQKAKQESKKQKAQNRRRQNKTKSQKNPRIEGPVAETAKEAVESLLKQKSFSKRINYAVFDELFKEGEQIQKNDEFLNLKNDDQQTRKDEEIDYMSIGLMDDLPVL